MFSRIFQHVRSFFNSDLKNFFLHNTFFRENLFAWRKMWTISPRQNVPRFIIVTFYPKLVISILALRFKKIVVWPNEKSVNAWKHLDVKTQRDTWIIKCNVTCNELRLLFLNTSFLFYLISEISSSRRSTNFTFFWRKKNRNGKTHTSPKIYTRRAKTNKR